MTVYYLKRMQKEDRQERSDRWEVVASLMVCFAIGFLIHLMYQVQKKEDVYREVLREDRLSYFAAALSERPDMVELLADKREQFTLIVPADVVVRLSSVSFDSSGPQQRKNVFANVEEFIFKGYLSPYTLTAGKAVELENLTGRYVTVTRKENFDRNLLEVDNQPIRKVIYADNGVIFVMNALVSPEPASDAEEKAD